MSTFRTILPALLLLLAASAAQADQTFKFKDTPGKLPKDVVPSAYRLDLVPDLDKLTFTGKEEVDVTLAKPTDTITLDANELAFQEVTASGEAGAAAVALNAAAQTATFHFPHKLAAGAHTLTIRYSGAIPETPAGLYYNDYATAEGKKRMLVSQFEATDARRMFPSWDEPVYKATFVLSVTLPKDLAVISNMPAAEETDAGNGLKKTRFGITPRMSTYLVVLCAGELDRIHDTAEGVDIGVWAVRGKAEQGRGALEAAKRILPYYNDYFGTAYPLPKLDLIAVPGNYAAGAMENWGGITFIDNALLFDPKNSSEATRQSIYLVLAHEMAHMWSGDLVTMAWWDNLWLNEGFASWMDAKATDKLNPAWHFWLNQHNDKEAALAFDAHSTTHPIQVPIRDESAIGSSFDLISYQKGEAFIRMLETWLGEDAFRDGMRRYMKKYAYSSATTADLWAELAAASGRPVAKMASGFTAQPGVPLISVASVCRDGQTVTTLTQGRYTVNDPKAVKFSWRVPVQIAPVGQDQAVKTVLVENGKASVGFPGCGLAMKANFDDVGYYRTEYDKAGFEALVVNYAKMSPADRVNFVTDAWALVEADRLSAARFLDLTRALSGENAPVVWSNLISALNQIDNLQRGEEGRAKYRRYAVSLLHPVLDLYGWDAKPDEDTQIKLVRGPLIAALGRFGDQTVLAESRKRFDAFLADPAALAPDIRSAVLGDVAQAADQATYDKLHALGKAASSTEEKLRYYLAIAHVRDPALADQALQIALTDEVSNGRVSYYVQMLLVYSDDPIRLWKATLGMRDKLMPKLPGDFKPRFLPALASATQDRATGAELATLPESSASEGAKIETRKAVEGIDFSVRLKESLNPAVAEWLGGKAG